VEELLPEICTLDCGTLNFGDGDTIYVSTPAQLRAGAKRIQELGVKAELEIFDTGHLWFAKQMIKEGLLDDPLFQLCLGIPWGAPADTTTMKAMVDNLPAGAVWAGFGIGRMQMPMAAQAVLLGGNVRVGWKTTCGWTRACWPPTANWWNAPVKSSAASARGS
jgi:uncharacterized protein (DUF849 family)